MSGKQLVPLRRFSNFKECWIRKTLASVSSDVMYGLGASAIPYDGENGYIRITDINDGSRAFEPNPITTPDIELSDSYLLNKGDIVFARTGATTGKSYIYKESDGKLYFAGFLIKVSIKGACPEFIYQNTFRAHYWNWVYVMSFRSGQPGINAEDLKKFPIFLPAQEEQQKIADFLSSVDKKISQLKEKHALLQQYKKGVMQQIFTQQIRFKDDKGKVFSDWKVEPLGKHIKEYKERVDASTNLPVLTSSRIGLCLQSDYYANRELANEGEYGVLPRGYFTYRHMSDDLVFKFNINQICDRGAISKEYPVFTTVSMNSYFLEMSLNEGDIFKRFAIQQKQGGTRTRLYFKNLIKMKICLPCLEEQNKIAGFLQSLDTKINLVAQQIEQTQQFKKGLLQQMFV